MPQSRATPENPEIEISAGVHAAEVQFEEVPKTDVTFFGSSRRSSVSGTDRENLPEEVEAGVTYRNSYVHLRIATKLVEADRHAGGGQPPEDSL